MQGIKLKDKVKMKVMINKMKYNQDIVHSMRRAKWGWMGHVLDKLTKDGQT